MEHRNWQETQNVCEIIDLVSDEDSDVSVADSSDEVEVISETSSSSILSISTDTCDDPQPVVTSVASEAVNEVQANPSSVFIEQLVKIVSVKQEPIHHGYEPINNGQHYRVEPTEELYFPDTQLKAENAHNIFFNQPMSHSCEPINNYGQHDTVESTAELFFLDTQHQTEKNAPDTLIGQGEANDVSHQGIQAVIAKLGVVDGCKEIFKESSNPPLLVYKDVSDNQFMSHKKHSYSGLHPQVVRKTAIVKKKTFSNDVIQFEDASEAPVFCDVCGRTFYDKISLKTHNKIHYEVYSEVCNLCGKKFRNVNRLNYHMLDHTGERPFRCDICGAGFKVQYHLQYHMFSHTDERPHVCETCGKSYKQFCHLKQHMKRHNKFFAFKCPECGKIFHGAGTLKSHMYKHTGEWPFKCQVCSKGFSNLKWCEIHEKTHEIPVSGPILDAAHSKSDDCVSRLSSDLPDQNSNCVSVVDIPPQETVLNSESLETHFKTEIPENDTISSQQAFPCNGLFVT